MTTHPHPPVVTAAADGSHTKGGMIALMPTAEDAARLAIPGGEPADELHLTLLYLGDDGGAWPAEARDALESAVREMADGVPAVQSRAFGAAHWNGDGDSPAWVWSVGDNPERALADSTLEEAQWIIGGALGMAMAVRDGDVPEVPEQHSPWIAHICAAYSGDPALLGELEARLGPVTFDLIRLSFGDDDRDIPLAGRAVNLTAAAGPLRREPTELETASRADFASVHAEWEAATAGAVRALRSTTAAWRLDLREQITKHLAADDAELLPDLALSTLDATATLRDLMEEFALKAGRACQREAERQGVTVPDWSLPEDGDGPDVLTAGIGGRRLLSSVAQLTSDLAASSLVQAAKRKLSGLLRSSAPAATVAAEVDRELAAMDDSGVRASVGSAMTAAQNAGRSAVMEAAPPASSYVASEILDRRTCGPCKAIDGRTFTTLDGAVAEYPVMGYRDCTGARYGNACRGFIVAVWQTTGSAVAATVSSASHEEMHGSLGSPSYRKYHPSGGQRKGKTRHAKGGMVGSSRYSEEEHRDVLRAYVGSDCYDMSDWLRHRKPPERSDLETVKRRNSVLNDLISIQDPSETDQEYWRGFKEGFLVQGLQVGDEFHDKGFVSASSDKWVAESVFSGRGGGIIRIKAPKGTQALRVSSVGASDEEEETVFPPGTRFRVTGLIESTPPRPSGYEVEILND